MRNKLLFILISAVIGLSAPARDFEYSYGGQTVNYTVLDEDAKTCETSTTQNNYWVGALYIPETAFDGDVAYTVVQIGKRSLGGRNAEMIFLPNTVEIIEEYAFFQSSNLWYIEIGSSVKTIRNSAFVGCHFISASFSSLELFLSITFEHQTSNPLNDGGTLLIDGNRVSEVVIPESINEIGDYAFSGCENLYSISFGSNVQKIGKDAFRSCHGLQKVEFDSVETLCNMTFDNQYSNPLNNYIDLYIAGKEITHLEIPEGVESIGNYALSQSKITSVSLPQSMQRIGGDAFLNCGMLEKAEYASLESLLGIEFVSIRSNPLIYAKHLYINGEEVTDVVIPSSVYRINNYTFINCLGLTSVTFSNKLSEIGTCAFSNCDLSEVVLPPTLLTIEAYAFADNTNLNTIIMGPEVESIGEEAFARCHVGNVYITAQNPPAAFGNTFSEYTGKLFVQGSDAKGKYKEAANCWNQFDSELMIVPADMISDCEQTIFGSSGDSFQFSATLMPENVTLPQIFWRTTNTSVATVDPNGLVTLDIAPDMIPDEDGTASCKLIAESLYADGPSLRFSINVNDSGVEDIAIDNVNGAEIDYSAPYEVYNLNGSCVGASTDALSAGIYILRQGSVAKKVALK